MKVAIVGVGGMGGCHFGIYKNLKNVELTAACDVRLDMLKEKAADCENIHLYDDFDKMLENESPDLIDVSTPTYLHTECVIKALNHGANVICEKPMALNSEETQRILDALEKNDKLFMTAHVVRFMNNYDYLKNVIDSKKYGKLIRLDLKRLGATPRWSFENWMLDESKSGLTPLDLMIHDVDFMQYVLGMPKEIQGMWYKLHNESDYIVANYLYDGCIVSAEASWYATDLPFSAEFSAVFENGYVRLKNNQLEDCGVPVEFDEAELTDTGINVSAADGYTCEIKYFIDCIEKGIKPQIVTPKSSALSVKLIEMTKEKLITVEMN